MRLDAPELARAWLSVRQASATKDDNAILAKTVAIEEYPHGVRLVATDRYMLLTAWVPSLDATSIREPSLDESPDRTVTARDSDGRGKSLLEYVVTLARRMELDDLPAGALEVRLDFDVKIPAGDNVPETFEGMEPTFVMLEIPETEKVYLSVVQAEYPEWRAVRHGFTAQATTVLALNPDLLSRVCAVSRWSDGPISVTFGGHDRVVAVDYAESGPHVTGYVMPSRWVLPGEDTESAEVDADEALSVPAV